MQPVALNGLEAWGYVVETDEEMRVRFDVDDWQRFGLGQGQRVPVRMAEEDDVWLFVTGVVEAPPVVWVTLSRRVRAAG